MDTKYGNTVDSRTETVFTTDMTTNYPRSDSIHEHYGRCQLHGVPCCSVCCKHEGECDYGDCNAPAVECLPCYNTAGAVIEHRPTCHQHATYGASGVGYDLKADEARNVAAAARHRRRVA